MEKYPGENYRKDLANKLKEARGKDYSYKKVKDKDGETRYFPMDREEYMADYEKGTYREEQYQTMQFVPSGREEAKDVLESEKKYSKEYSQAEVQKKLKDWEVNKEKYKEEEARKSLIRKELDIKQAKELLGEKFDDLSGAGAQDLAIEISRWLKSSEGRNYSSTELLDIFTREKLAATLVRSGSWSSSGGFGDISISLDLSSNSGFPARADMYFMFVQDRSGVERGMPQYNYSKIETIEEDEDFFYVKFEGDTKFWKIGKNKDYMVHMKQGKTHGFAGYREYAGVRGEIVVEETIGYNAHISTPDGVKTISNVSKEERKKFIEEIYDKYGPTLHGYNTDETKKSSPVESIRVDAAPETN